MLKENKYKINSMRRRNGWSIVWLFALMVGCTTHEKYYVKEVTFPEGVTPEQKIEMAARVVPTAGQYQWQQLELTAFIHFGIFGNFP